MNVDGMAGEYHKYGQVRDSFIILVVRPKGKISLADQSVDEMIISKLVIKEMRLEDANWIHVIHDRAY